MRLHGDQHWKVVDSWHQRSGLRRSLEEWLAAGRIGPFSFERIAFWFGSRSVLDFMNEQQNFVSPEGILFASYIIFIMCYASDMTDVANPPPCGREPPILCWTCCCVGQNLFVVSTPTKSWNDLDMTVMSKPTVPVAQGNNSNSLQWRVHSASIMLAATGHDVLSDSMIISRPRARSKVCIVSREPSCELAVKILHESNKRNWQSRDHVEDDTNTKSCQQLELFLDALSNV